MKWGHRKASNSFDRSISNRQKKVSDAENRVERKKQDKANALSSTSKSFDKAIANRQKKVSDAENRVERKKQDKARALAIHERVSSGKAKAVIILKNWK